LRCCVLDERAENRERYDAFIRSASRPSFLQSWNWGEVKRRTGWLPLRVVLEDDGRIVAAALLLARAVPLIRRPLLYCPRGPVVDFRDQATVRALFDGIREVARSRGAFMLKIDPPVRAEEREVRALLEKLGFRRLAGGKNFESIQPRFVMRLRLDKDLDSLLADCTPKTRYNIRYAQRKGVTVRTSTDERDLARFYEILEVTARRNGFGIRDFSYYRDLMELMIRPGSARLFLAEYQGQLLAGAISFICGDTVWYVYGASSNERRNLQPNYALQWAMISWAHAEGCRIYDFRGVSGDLNPENPLYGLYRFKRGFNPELVEYLGEFDLVYNRLYYHLWTRGEPLYRRLGSLIRR